MINRTRHIETGVREREREKERERRRTGKKLCATVSERERESESNSHIDCIFNTAATQLLQSCNSCNRGQQVRQTDRQTGHYTFDKQSSSRAATAAT